EASYCSRSCQKADWPNHKVECGGETSQQSRRLKQYLRKEACSIVCRALEIVRSLTKEKSVEIRLAVLEIDLKKDIRSYFPIQRTLEEEAKKMLEEWNHPGLRHALSTTVASNHLFILLLMKGTSIMEAIFTPLDGR